ncbi:PREDICTED: uncharacterized protein LOC108975365 [Bactrocera latifrons]|uniref:Transmembrane protein 178 n=1 Tax=Bactrocera latifrons TaxID=174628 RepID=A0A0K8UDB4_BACLA|nr:PREDICTED: uncharacterized protein LOC108975365 [Bactrocera latifrons]XP_018799354.1 PREDICTED: uncharacterized protein LOC108975365 [Bactrocera latifrons]
MIRDVSSSTLGREEERKPLMAAYMFQRRVLFGCSVLMVVSLIMWIVAISTDHWVIITGGKGIFIPETRRFFMDSHSGLWVHCRHTKTPNALPTANVVRNFTSIAYVNPATLMDAKLNASALEFVREFSEEIVEIPMKNFTESARRRMFAHWVRNDEEEFKAFKKIFEDLVLNTTATQAETVPINAKPIAIDPLNVREIESRKIFGTALQKVRVNATSYYFVIPEAAQLAIFAGWNGKPYVPKLFWPYVRDLGVPAFVLDDHQVILQLVPPLPPSSGREANGYVYQPNERCKYIDMFTNPKSLNKDPGIDVELMDYIRTQASFACITVFVMSLGSVFSFYTFKNPRYMFKRLAGGIHLVSASTAVVVLQVLFSSVDYTKKHLFYAYPEGAELTYGYGVYLAWFTFIVNLVCGILFMWYSGKKKGAKAPNDEVAMADEPTIMGR